MSVPRATLGASLALTGPEAPYGRQMRAALELALADAGGACTLIVQDDEGDPAAAVRAARALAASPAIAVVGPMNSWTCEVQGPIFAEAGLPHVAPSASNPRLSRQGWPTFFRACPSDDHQARVLAGLARHLVRAGRVAGVHDHTSFAEPLIARFADEAAALGIEVVGLAGITSDPRSHDALPAVVDARPAAILVAGLEAECAAAAAALRGAGFRGVFLGTDAGKPSHTLRIPGSPSPILTNSAVDARQLAPDFHARVLDRIGVHDSVYTVEAYDVALHLARLGVARPSLSRHEILAVLRQPFSGLAGTYQFDAHGERVGATIGIYRDDPEALCFLGTDATLLPA